MHYLVLLVFLIQYILLYENVNIFTQNKPFCIHLICESFVHSILCLDF